LHIHTQRKVRKIKPLNISYMEKVPRFTGDLGGRRKYVQQALGDASMDFELPKEGIFRLLFSSSNVNVAG
ncbi:hypothetical protein SO802_014002, partial [Lithocarpus litseifolius]